MRLVILMFTLLFMTPVQAETLTVVVQSMNSQPYYNARLLGKYMVKHYPGATDSLVKVVPGANGLNAANYLYNIAPKDGLTFGTFTKPTTLAGILGDKYAQFETDKFIWLGSTSDNRNNPGVIVSHGRYDGVELNMGEQGTTESSTVDMLNSISGWKLKRISGYKNVPEIRLAFLRKEIDMFFIQYSTLMATNPELKDKIILQYGNGLLRNVDLPEVPTLMEMAIDDKMRYRLSLRELSEILARPFVIPPGAPKDKVILLREAFFKAMNDPELKEEADTMSIDISPIFWSQAENVIKQMKSIDKELLRTSN